MVHSKLNNSNKYTLSGHKRYFNMNIHERINERQQRNALNINYLFATTISQCNIVPTSHPVINNGLYHHIGKTHSKYPKN